MQKNRTDARYELILKRFTISSIRRAQQQSGSHIRYIPPQNIQYLCATIFQIVKTEIVYVSGLIFLAWLSSCYCPEASGMYKEYADIEIRKTPTRHMA